MAGFLANLTFSGDLKSVCLHESLAKKVPNTVKPYHQYPNLIFDLGGVIINLSYQATIDEFSKICGRDMTKAYSQASQVPVFDQLETGQIGAEEFYQGLRAHFQTDAQDQALAKAWNAMLLDIPPARIELLQNLKKAGKRLFLLSNTNGIHKPIFEDILEKATGLPNLDGLFETAYYSHLVGDRKPNESIFEHVLADSGLKADDTLFIEDSIQHIEAARRVGIHAHHLVPTQDIRELGLLEPK